MDKIKEINNFLDWNLAPQPTAPDDKNAAAEVRIFGDIHEGALAELDAALVSGSDVEFFINSPGGNVFDGVAMASLIKRHNGKTTASGVGLVASIASVILLAADRVRMDKDAFLMIHNAWSYDAGDSEQLRKTADILDKISEQIANIYALQVQKNNKLIAGDYEKTKKKIKKMMTAETWLNAEEALAFGLIDEITQIEAPQLSGDILKDIVNKYGASAPTQFLNKYKPMQNDNENKATEQAPALNFWEQLKAYFKSEPAKVEEVIKDAKAEAEAKAEAVINNALETVKTAGFVVMSADDAEQIEQNKTALELANAENERLLARLAEFEAEASAPTAKAASIEQEQPKTAREALIMELAKNIEKSKFFNNLNN